MPGNLHKYGAKACNFASQFLDDFLELEIPEYNEDYPDCINLCCCSPEMPHDESMKFVLLSKDSEYLQRKPFEFMEEGTVNIVNPLPQENEPVTMGNLPAVGRNIPLQHIIDSLAYNTTTQTRMVHLYGAAGIGKTFIAKHAAKYLFERRFFNYG